MIKRRSNKRIRKREKSDDEGEEAENTTTQIVRNEKKRVALIGSSTKKTQPEDAIGVTFAASGTAASLLQDTSTRTLDVDGADEEAKEGDVLVLDDAGTGFETYKGRQGYTEFVNKKTEKVNQMNASRIRAGPLKGPTNVRISCRFDYAPDICKDYKETGYCGYGDSCKFMHDRGDYKAGWQIDQEWEKQQKALAEGKSLEDEDSKWLIKEGQESDQEEHKSDDDEFPFACLICRKDFVRPVVTRCEHYFCEQCAIKHHLKSPKCFSCGAATNGVFNAAKELELKLAERQKRMAAIVEQEKEEKEDEEEEET